MGIICCCQHKTKCNGKLGLAPNRNMGAAPTEADLGLAFIAQGKIIICFPSNFYKVYCVSFNNNTVHMIKIDNNNNNLNN